MTRALGFFAVLALCGCNKTQNDVIPPFKFAVRAESDPGKPLAGVKVLVGEKELVTSPPSGRGEFSIVGTEGEKLSLVIQCPAGFVAPPSSPKSVDLVLSRLADGRVIELPAVCTPAVRRVVVGVRADNGPNLPVMFLGSMVARTDASGAAHFALDVRPGESFNVSLDTTTAPQLKPQNPTKPFTIRNEDDLVVFDVPFVAPKKKVWGPARPTGPRPVGGGMKAL